MHTIRRLQSDEAVLYRSTRLEALKESPGAFTTTYESALGRTEESWRQQADAAAAGGDGAIFLVFADGEPVGLAALYRDADQTRTGELVQMWISPSHRGSSAATDLLDYLCVWAAGHDIGTIRAEVTLGNARALRFYEKYGFCHVTHEGDGILLAKAGLTTKPEDGR